MFFNQGHVGLVLGRIAPPLAALGPLVRPDVPSVGRLYAAVKGGLISVFALTGQKCIHRSGCVNSGRSGPFCGGYRSGSLRQSRLKGGFLCPALVWATHPSRVCGFLGCNQFLQIHKYS
jgi:hypothetical protein